MISKLILNDLLKIYERRDANSSSLKNVIKIPLTTKKYPQYFNDREGYDEAIKDLCNKGYIKVKLIPNDDVIDYIALNTEKIVEIKNICNIDSINNKREILFAELDKYDNIIVNNFKNMLIERINTNKSIKQYLSNEYIDSFKVIDVLEKLEKDIFERNLSNNLFNDSKRVLKLKNIIQSIYDDEDIFVKKGVLSNPSFIYCKGEGVISLNGQTIDLSLIPYIGLPPENIDFINIDKVTTIENLTTFHDYKDKGIVIYLGGFSSRNKIKLLNSIDCEEIYHFSDIDYGGFSILSNLISNVNKKVIGIHMDISTLEKHLKYTNVIHSSTYINKLNSLLTIENLKPYYDVIKYMIDNKLRLEQEALYNHI